MKVDGPRWVPTLEDSIEIAAVLLGTSPDQVRRLPRIGLAESAIHAPFASFGGQSAYTGLTVQAAVLIAHLAQNHPLPDGNKRAAFLLTARFMGKRAAVEGAGRRGGRRCRRGDRGEPD